MVIFPLCFLCYYRNEYYVEVVFDRIHSIYCHERLNDPNDIHSGFNSFSSQVYTIDENLFHGTIHKSDVIDIFLALSLFKLVDQERIIQSKDRMDELLD